MHNVKELAEYKKKGFVELIFAMLFFLSLIVIYGLLKLKIGNQVIFHIIYFSVALMGFYMIAIRVLKEEYIKSADTLCETKQGFNFFKYLVVSQFLDTKIKKLTTLYLLVFLVTIVFLDIVGSGSEFSFHRIKILVGALVIAALSLPNYKEDELPESAQNESPVSASLLNEPEFKHEIDCHSEPEEVAAARKVLAKAYQPVISKREENTYGEWENYAPESKDALIELLESEDNSKFDAALKWVTRVDFDDDIRKTLEKRAVSSKTTRQRLKAHETLVICGMHVSQCNNYLNFLLDESNKELFEKKYLPGDIKRIVPYAISKLASAEQSATAQKFLQYENIILNNSFVSMLDVFISESLKDNENIINKAAGSPDFEPAIEELVALGILASRPSAAEIFYVENNIGKNSDKAFKQDLRITKKLFEELLLNSPFIRSYDAAKPNVFNEDLLYKGLELCAPHFKLEGVWEEGSDTPEAKLHWIIDNKYYSSRSSGEHLEEFDWQISITNKALSTLGVNGRVFYGHGDDFTYLWFYDPTILGALLEKNDVRYYCLDE